MIITLEDSLLYLTLIIRYMIVRIFTLLLFIFSSTLFSELRIEIKKGIKDPIRIAIVPIVWNLKSPPREYLHKIISSDLESFGEFESLSTKEMLSMPQYEEEIFYRDWKLLDVDYLVLGLASQGNDSKEIIVNFSIFNVTRQRLLKRSISVGSLSYLNSLAHVISDRIYSEINGLPGISSTKISYINQNNSSETKFFLRVADIDGRNDSSIFSSTEPLMSPSWSSDGKRLAYVSFEEGTSRIFIQEIYTGRRKGLKLEKGINSSPTWSPKDMYLAAVLSKEGNPDIYRYDLKKDSWKQLTNHFGIDTEPDWSPDGRRIIFTSNRSGTPQIYEMNVASKKIRRKTFEGTYNARARYTPDGKSFVFVHRRDRLFHIAVQNFRTGKLQILTDTTLDESPTISPNGKVIIYATRDGDKDILAGISIDGKTRFILPTNSGGVREPSWSPLLVSSSN